MGEKLKNVEEGSSYGLILEDCGSTLAEKLERQSREEEREEESAHLDMLL